MKAYDFVFSLGGACACTQCLRRCGLQFASFPFDWLLGEKLSTRTGIVAAGFENWLNVTRLELIVRSDGTPCDVYRDIETGLVFKHDFAHGVSLRESFPAVKAKYDRRVDRLRRHLSSADRVLMVWIGLPGCPASTRDELEQCLSAFRRRFPGPDFELLAFSCVDGVVAENAKKVTGAGYTHYAFDYRDRSDGFPRYPIRQEMIDGFLRGLSARDYRTHAERRSYADAERRRKYSRYGAKWFLEYVLRRVINRFQKVF